MKRASTARLGIPSAELGRVAAAVAAATGLSESQLTGDARPSHIAGPRLLCYALQSELTGATDAAIASWWARHRGAIRHGIRWTANQEATVPTFKPFADELRRKLGIPIRK